MSPLAAASGTAEITIRSRSRSSRSAANRRGSCPASTTWSMAWKTAAPSSAANAVDDLVEQPVVGVAEQRDGPVVAQAALVRARHQLVEHGQRVPTEPAPARITIGSTGGSYGTPSLARICSRCSRSTAGGTSRNG